MEPTWVNCQHFIAFGTRAARAARAARALGQGSFFSHKDTWVAWVERKFPCKAQTWIYIDRPVGRIDFSVGKDLRGAFGAAEFYSFRRWFLAPQGVPQGVPLFGTLRGLNSVALDVLVPQRAFPQELGRGAWWRGETVHGRIWQDETLGCAQNVWLGWHLNTRLSRVHTGSVAVLTQIAASDNATPCRDDSIVIPSWGRSVTQLLLRWYNAALWHSTCQCSSINTVGRWTRNRNIRSTI